MVAAVKVTGVGRRRGLGQRCGGGGWVLVGWGFSRVVDGNDGGGAGDDQGL